MSSVKKREVVSCLILYSVSKLGIVGLSRLVPSNKAVMTAALSSDTTTCGRGFDSLAYPVLSYEVAGVTMGDLQDHRTARKESPVRKASTDLTATSANQKTKTNYATALKATIKSTTIQRGATFKAATLKAKTTIFMQIRSIIYNIGAQMHLNTNSFWKQWVKRGLSFFSTVPSRKH